MPEERAVEVKLTAAELRYVIACGMALVQNVPAASLPTYCGLTKEEIIEFSRRLRELADASHVEM